VGIANHSLQKGVETFLNQITDHVAPGRDGFPCITCGCATVALRVVLNNHGLGRSDFATSFSIGSYVMPQCRNSACIYKHIKRAEKVSAKAFLQITGIDQEPVRHYACKLCGVVEETAQLKRCGQCRVVYYCSKNCQVLDWAAHRGICKS